MFLVWSLGPFLGTYLSRWDLFFGVMSVVGPKGPQAEKVPLCRSPTGPWGGVVSRRPSFTRPLRLSPSIATYPSRRRSEEEGTEPLRAPPRRLVDSLSHIMVGQVVRILALRPFPTPPPSPTTPSTGAEGSLPDKVGRGLCSQGVQSRRGVAPASRPFPCRIAVVAIGRRCNLCCPSSAWTCPGLGGAALERSSRT